MRAGALEAALGALAWVAAGAYGIAVLERIIAPAAGGRRSAWALAQPLASAARLLHLRAEQPPRADAALSRSAPVAAIAAVALAAWFLPRGGGVDAGQSPVGLFLFVALLGPVVVALANAGWAANGKYGLVASMRAISHIVAYEVVLGFAVLGPVMAAESLSVTRIVEAQRSEWFVLWQPLGLLLYLASAAFTTYRAPFDTPVSGEEIAGGVLAEQRGGALLLFRAALAGLLFVLSALGAALYLGGWHAPPGLDGGLAPGLWMLLKTYLLAALLLWVGDWMPRLPHECMLAFSWKVVLPLSLANLALVGVLILFRGP